MGPSAQAKKVTPQVSSTKLIITESKDCFLTPMPLSLSFSLSLSWLSH